MRKLSANLFVCYLLFFSNALNLNAKSFDKYEVISLLSLNTARFTRWPKTLSDRNSTELNFCLISDNAVKASFSSIEKKPIQTKNINLVYISRFRNLTHCHVLYIDQLDQNHLTQVLLEIKGLAILTIGENLSFLDAGGMVAFTHNKGKIQININLTNLKKSGLVINSRLLNLANIQDRSQIQQIQKK